MDIENLITNVAFPIATTLICMYYIREQNNDAREERKELLDGMSKKIDALTNLICAVSTPEKISKNEVIDYED